MRFSELYKNKIDNHFFDFYDIDLDHDNCLFIDPYYIIHSKKPICSFANKYINDFFKIFTNNLRYNISEAHEQFSYFHESNETYLGYSNGKPRGKGIGVFNTEKIFNAILDSNFFSKIEKSDLSDLKIYVKGLSNDLLSDMVTAIIKNILLEYTFNQCERFNIEMKDFEFNYWDLESHGWEKKWFKLPTYEDKPIILVPRDLLSKNPYFNFTNFIDRYIVQNYRDKYKDEDYPEVERKVLKDGTTKRILTLENTKKIMKRNNIKFDKSFAVEFAYNHPKVFEEFKNSSLDKYEGVLDIVDVNKITIILKEKLNNLPTGPEYASEFERIVCSTLLIAFYPNLNNPVLHDSIEGGTKIVDTTFYNNAENGFFNMITIYPYDIPCNYVFVECKNYSSDIGNPEIDQLCGRFSANRGKFGISVCRSLENEEKFREREINSARAGRGYVIHLTDKDLLYLLDNYLEEDKITTLFKTKFDYIFNY